MSPETKAAIADMQDGLAAFDAIRKRIGRDTLTRRPEGGLTVAEYAARYQIAEQNALRELTKMVDLGEAERVLVRMAIPCGRMARVWVYTVKGKPA